jgi:hypothetical protein
MNWMKTLVGLLAVAAGCSAVAAPLLSEGFDDVAALPGAGWVLLNQSTPPGSTGWFQGEPAFFPAAAGPADSYIAANFNNAAFGGMVSNWLLTPQVLLVNGEALTFSLRLLGEGLMDRVEVYFSGNGASSDVNRDYRLLAAYESDTDTGWQQRSVLVDGLAAPASGRLAFRYVVDDTSLNGNFIGIDSVSVTAVPTPATVALVCLGLVALCATRRARRPWLAAGLYAGMLAAQAAQAADDGVMRFPHVQVVQQQAAPSAAEQGGFMAYKDPVTGQLTGPDPELAALLTAAARAPAPLMRQARPVPKAAQGGGVSLMLDDRQVRYAVARKAADGSITHSCEPAAGEHK